MTDPEPTAPAARHSWDVTPSEARALQSALAGEVIAEDRFGDIATVAGVDVGFERGGEITRAAVAVLSFPDLEPLCEALARRPTSFPYVPGLLSFREIPAVLDALERLDTLPDLILCDGQGRAHPRRFGIACHLGVLSGLPTIGVAKSRLTGRHDEPPDRRGAWVPLEQGNEVIGGVLRSRAGVKPLYVSLGHRVSLASALRFTMACVTRYKLPETTRHAHRLASGTPG